MRLLLAFAIPLFVVAIVSAVLAPQAMAAPPSNLPQPELGRVHWRTGFDAAALEAKTTGKPLLVLFDEVPGCSTVRGFGGEVLSHPLIAEAIETLFVPVFVQNNSDGEDRAVLRRFGEPAWNNPVVRFLGPDGKAIAERFDGPYTRAEFLDRMSQALAAAKVQAPEWVRTVIDEEKPASVETTFVTSCFWEGEASLGSQPGVVKTETGYAGSHEVVKVKHTPESADRLREAARKAGYSPVGATDFRFSASDDKYQLARSTLRFVPMTPLQKSRVNAAVGAGEDPSRFLSPRQLELWKHAGGNSAVVLHVDDIREAWALAGR